MVIVDELYLQEYLLSTLDEDRIEIPGDINIAELVAIFSCYLESDIYEWLRDNYKAFFRDVDWDQIRESQKNAG